MDVIEIPYHPRPLQKELHNSLKRFSVVVCHRRFGKTVFAINELIRTALTCTKPNPRCHYVAPLHKQAKQIAWDYLKEFSRVIPDVKFNESELRADYPNGGRVQLLGADNPDSARGIYSDMVVLDEFAQMNPKMWSEILRPAISDRYGKAIFIGTPKGMNAFYDQYQYAKEDNDWLDVMYKVSETKIIPEIELKILKKDMTQDEYDQEFECSWQAAIRGAYYAKYINHDQVVNIPIDRNLRVSTYWDLGVDDSTVIMMVQNVGLELRVIDFYEQQGEGLDFYIRYLDEWRRKHNVIFDRHYAPHDIKVRELSTGKSRLETALKMGLRFEVVPNQSIEDGIHAARQILPRVWFDKERCKTLVRNLGLYRKEFDDKNGVWKNKPLHDYTSHAADAFRYFALTWRDKRNTGNNLPRQARGFSPI